MTSSTIAKAQEQGAHSMTYLEFFREAGGDFK
jgi:hypothetical protein